MKTWHIIGAGIAGLAAAKSIKAQWPGERVVLYEAATHCGGRCYSFHDKKLQMEIDNATHVVLGANKHVRALLGDVFFRRNGYRSKIRLALKSMFNTDPKDIPLSGLFKVLAKLFPFTNSKLSLYFSQNDLSQALIEPLQKHADEIKYGFALEGFKHRDERITALEFSGGERVEVGDEDMVVSAMDASNYHKIFGGPAFDFSQIINIIYRTDISGLDYMTAENAGVDWIFCAKGTVTAVISDARQLPDAAETWRKICEICGWETVSVPAFRVLAYPRATIKQDRKNNARRNVRPAFSNLRVIGDWTMKDWPCSLETAVVSATKNLQLS